MGDQYPIAAMRHYVDGNILRQEGRWNNAMCHYAFSAECFLKTIYEEICNKKLGKRHGVEGEYQSMLDYYTLVCMTDVRTEILLGGIKMPEQLFEDHPERRYKADRVYTEETMEQTHRLTQIMMRELTAQLLDGRILPDESI
jgi:hypothetical protein